MSQSLVGPGGGMVGPDTAGHPTGFVTNPVTGVAASEFGWNAAGFGSGGLARVPSAFTLTAAPEGGWVWFGAPRAIVNGSTTIIGYIRNDGDVKAVIVDNATRAILSTTTLYDNFLVDDHEPPSFVVRPDGVILAAFAYHVGPIYAAIGQLPGLLPAQAQVVNITSQVGALAGGAGYTYASIQYLEDEDRYYIFFRYHDATGVPYVGYTYSDDGGVTWAARTLLQQITYHHVVKNGTGRFDLVLSDHPDHGQGDNGAVHTSIYHLYYDGSWHGSNGSTLTPIIGNTAATLVYSGATSRGWLWDIALDSGGQPVVVYVVYDEPYPTGTWHYQYARWTGSAWETNEIANAGGTIVTSGSEHYAGGITIDALDSRIVYYSSNASGLFQMYRAVTLNGGATWTTHAITVDANKNVRPVAVLGAGPFRVLWLRGTYIDYFTYAQGISEAELLTGVAASGFRFSSAATTLQAQDVTGVADSSFGWSTSAVGAGPHTGVAASSFGFSTDGAGIVAQPVSNTTVANSSFGFSTAGTGLAATSPVLGIAGSAFGWRSDSAGVVGPVSVTGAGASTFGWSTTADGTNVAPPSTGLPRDERIWRMFFQRVGAWYMKRPS